MRSRCGVLCAEPNGPMSPYPMSSTKTTITFGYFPVCLLGIVVVVGGAGLTGFWVTFGAGGASGTAWGGVPQADFSSLTTRESIVRESLPSIAIERLLASGTTTKLAAA